MDEACNPAPIPTQDPTTPPQYVRFNITQVSNGYLVETKDKNWNGVESVHLNIDTVVEALKEALIKN